MPAAAPSGTAQPHGGHQARRWPGAGSCWARVGRGQRRLENEGIDCETDINDPRLSSVDLFLKNPSSNLTKCSDAPGPKPVGPSGVGKESGTVSGPSGSGLSLFWVLCIQIAPHPPSCHGWGWLVFLEAQGCRLRAPHQPWVPLRQPPCMFIEGCLLSGRKDGKSSIFMLGLFHV